MIIREGDSPKRALATVSGSDNPSVVLLSVKCPLQCLTIEGRKTTFGQRHRESAIGAVVSRLEQTCFSRFETSCLHGYFAFQIELWHRAFGDH